MLKGLGCDMIEVERIRQALSRPSFLRRVYTLEERAAIARKGAQTAAGFWAAKEAVSKALGTGFAQGIMPEQIEVTHADSGQPGARLTGAAQARLERMGGGRILLSLSHEGDTAIAFALIQ